MNIATGWTALIISCLALCLALGGCVGYVQGDGGGVAVATPVVEPGFFWFGGFGDGWLAHDYGRRGWASRGGFRR